MPTSPGQEALQTCDYTRAQNQHERDEILLEARILTVADVVEAMASHRPYRPALGIDATLAEIHRGKGAAFDVAVVDACSKLFREERFAFKS